MQFSLEEARKSLRKGNMKPNTSKKKTPRTQNPASSDDPADQAQSRKDTCEADSTECIEVEQASDAVHEIPEREKNDTPGGNSTVDTKTIHIKHGPRAGTYDVHAVAQLFPLMTGKAYDDLKGSIELCGQNEPIVFDGNIFLDGRNRVRILNELGMEPWIVELDEVAPDEDLNAGSWIELKNRQRRHLTPDQILASEAAYAQWCVDEDERITKSEQDNDGPDAPAQNHPTLPEGTLDKGEPEGSGDFPQKAAEIPKSKKTGRPAGGKRRDATELARKTKQTRYRAEMILKLRESSPELAEAVMNGQKTLKAAAAELKRQQGKRRADNTRNRDEERQGSGPQAKAINNAIHLVLEDARKRAHEFNRREKSLFWAGLASKTNSMSKRIGC
jgi:hypothetical protein